MTVKVSVMIAYTGFVLVGAALFGGGTHSGFLGDVLVQGLATPLLIAVLWSMLACAESDRQVRSRLILLGGFLIFALGLQLFPLPFDLWSGGESFTGSHLEQDIVPKRTWATLSMTPQASWAALASLIVPAAVFLSVLQLSLRERLLLTWVLGALGAADLTLGFLQVAQGPASALRFYDVTNLSEAVGFFANRNHFAAHLYVTLIIASVWFATVASQLRKGGAALKSRSLLWATAAALFLISTIAGLAMARSRAGVFLSILALAGVILMFLRQKKRKTDNGGGHVRAKALTGLILVTPVLLGVLFTALFGLGSILSRFEEGALDDLRIALTWTTLETAFKSLPFGTGLGSFPQVYAAVVNDAGVSALFVNRAHNDLAELLLETGVVGAILLGAFLAWFCRRAYKAWATPSPGREEAQLLLQRASTLIVFLLLAHSIVDYPLRTTALSALFAFFCSCLATEVQEQAHGQETPTQGKRRRASSDRRSPSKLMEAEKWGADIQWPGSWRQPARRI